MVNEFSLIMDPFQKIVDIIDLRARGQFLRMEEEINSIRGISDEYELLADLLQVRLYHVLGVDIDFETYARIRIKEAERLEIPYLLLMCYTVFGELLDIWGPDIGIRQIIEQGQDLVDSLDNPSKLEKIAIMNYYDFVYWSEVRLGSMDNADMASTSRMNIAKELDEYVLVMGALNAGAPNPKVTSRKGDTTVNNYKKAMQMADDRNYYYTSGNVRFKLYLYYLNVKHDYESAETYLKEVIEKNRFIDSTELKSAGLNSYIQFLLKQDKMDEAEKYMNTWEEYREKYNYSELELHWVRANYYLVQKNWKYAIKHLTSLVLKSETENISRKHRYRYYHQLYLCYARIGNLVEADEILHTMNDLARRLGEGYQSQVIEYWGSILSELGRYEAALDTYATGLEIRYQMLKYSKEIVIHIVSLLFNMFITSLRMGNTNKAKDYLTEMKKLQVNYSKQNYYEIQVAEALLLQIGPRLRDRTKAQEILEELLEVDVKEELKRIILLTYADLMIFEIESLQDEVLISLFEEICERIKKNAAIQDSLPYKIEAGVLDAYLQILKGEYEKTEVILSNLEDLVSDLAQEPLHDLVKRKKSEFYDNMSEIRKFDDPTIRSKINKMRMHNYIKDAMNLLQN